MPHPLLTRLFPGCPFHVDGFHEEIEAASPPGSRLLDLGCGDNTMLERYHSLDREVWGTDLQPHPELRHPERFRLMEPGGFVPFPDDHFDTVASQWVLEHVLDPGTFLDEIARVLKPGGRFVAHTINGGHYVTWIRRALGILPHSLNQRLVEFLYGRKSHDTFPTRYRLNGEEQIRRACVDRGLSLVGIRRYPDAGYFRFSEASHRLAICCDWLLDRIDPAWGRLYLTVTLQKQPKESDRVPPGEGSRPGHRRVQVEKELVGGLTS